MRKTKHVTKPLHHCCKVEKLKYLHVSYPAQAHSKKLLFTNDFNGGIVLNKNNNANNVSSQINEPRDVYNNIPTAQFTETKINPDTADFNAKLLNYLMDIISGKRQIRGCNIMEESGRTFMKLEISTVEGSQLIKSTNVASINNNSETQTYETFNQKPEAFVEERPIPKMNFPPFIENNTNNMEKICINNPNVAKYQNHRQTKNPKKPTNQKSTRKYPKLKPKHDIIKRRKRVLPVKAKKLIRRAINPRTKIDFDKTSKIRLENRNLKPGTYLLPKTTQEPKYESVSVEDKSPKNEPIMKFVPLQNFNTFDEKLTQLSTASSSDINHVLTSKRSKNTDYEMTNLTI